LESLKKRRRKALVLSWSKERQGSLEENVEDGIVVGVCIGDQNKYRVESTFEVDYSKIIDILVQLSTANIDRGWSTVLNLYLLSDLRNVRHG
jgi:hypothetical protein